MDQILPFISGMKFNCNQIIAPIKNEAGDVFMHILTFENADEVSQLESAVACGATTSSGGIGKCNSPLCSSMRRSPSQIMLVLRKR